MRVYIYTYRHIYVYLYICILYMRDHTYIPRGMIALLVGPQFARVESHSACRQRMRMMMMMMIIIIIIICPPCCRLSRLAFVRSLL